MFHQLVAKVFLPVNMLVYFPAKPLHSGSVVSVVVHFKHVHCLVGFGMLVYLLDSAIAVAVAAAISY